MDVYEKEDALFFEDWSAVSSEDRMKSWDRRWAGLPCALPRWCMVCSSF
jgi:hypothetical protein